MAETQKSYAELTELLASGGIATISAEDVRCFLRSSMRAHNCLFHTNGIFSFSSSATIVELGVPSAPSQASAETDIKRVATESYMRLTVPNINNGIYLVGASASVRTPGSTVKAALRIGHRPTSEPDIAWLSWPSALTANLNAEYTNLACSGILQPLEANETIHIGLWRDPAGQTENMPVVYPTLWVMRVG